MRHGVHKADFTVGEDVRSSVLTGVGRKLFRVGIVRLSPLVPQGYDPRGGGRASSTRLGYGWDACDGRIKHGNEWLPWEEPGGVGGGGVGGGVGGSGGESDAAGVVGEHDEANHDEEQGPEAALVRAVREIVLVAADAAAAAPRLTSNYGPGDVVSLSLDLDHGTLSAFRNGEPVGVAHLLPPLQANDSPAAGYMWSCELFRGDDWVSVAWAT